MTEHYLTKATLAPSTRSIGALLAETAGSDGGHRLLWSLFPTSPDRPSQRDFIFRRIDDRRYLIVSSRLPADSHALWQLGPKPYDPEPQAGESYHFILRANPVMAISQKGHKRSLRVDAVMHAKRAARTEQKPWGREEEEAAALAWLFARQGHIGVTFDRNRCRITAYEQHRVSRKSDEIGKADQPARFSTVDYEGRLTVEDPARFRKTLFVGIGKARAFGCGLMLIRPEP
jgi:CRISPR system Cascade subunit CasE